VKGDVEACADVGMKHVVIEIATSHYKMKANNFTPDGVLGKVWIPFSTPRAAGSTCIFRRDATRADIHYLETIYRKAVNEAKADEVVIVDTLASLHGDHVLPDEKTERMGNRSHHGPLHSDFGLGRPAVSLL